MWTDIAKKQKKIIKVQTCETMNNIITHLEIGQLSHEYEAMRLNEKDWIEYSIGKSHPD